METLKKIAVKLGWLAVMVAVCAVVYSVTAHYAETYPVSCKVIDKIVEIIAVGVIWGLVIDGARIIGVFKDELKAIVECEDYLKRRTDINHIWKNATVALLNDKFPDIQDDLMETVRKYMVRDRVYHCEGFNKTTEIRLLNKKTGIIKVREVVKYDLVTDSAELLDRPIKVTTIVRDRREYRCEMRYIKVDEENMTNKVKATEKIEKNGDTCKIWTLPLQGKTRYTIQYERETEYNIKDDYFVGFTAANIIKDMSVDLTLGKGLEATFKSRGTQKEFIPVLEERRRIKMEYKGIILPRQGYFFALRTLK